MDATLERVWAGFSQKLRRFIRRRVSGAEAAEDVLQDVFLKIGGRLDRLRDPSKLEPWVYRIARRAVIDHYRSRRGDLELPESLLDPRRPEPDELEGLMKALRRMIDGLPPPYREALVLTQLDGLSQKELAARLGIPAQSARSRVQRARAMLREMLLECCRFEFDRRGGVIDCLPRRKGDCRECR